MSHFEYLSGAVHVRCPCPPHLRNGLGPFYVAPNSDTWDSPYTRILYHETIHFWQVLSSGYLANLVASEWLRFAHFVRSGEIRDVAPALDAFRTASEHGFSAAELSECWARFWDVHTRNPRRVVQQEVEPFAAAEDVAAVHLEQPYSGADWDLVMQRGVEHSTYEVPYRWMLDRLRRAPSVRTALGHRKLPDDDDLVRGVASYLAALHFPAVVHAAFGSKEPVAVFCRCVDRLAAEPALVCQTLENKSRLINVDWLSSWTFIHGELIRPVLRELAMPDFTPGLDVIHRGPLGAHPTYASYLKRWPLLGLLLQRERDAFDARMAAADVDDLLGLSGLADPVLHNALTALPLDDPWVVFAQPGQPSFRVLLGQVMAPPVVQFDDDAVHPVITLGRNDGDDDFRDRLDEAAAGWHEQTAALGSELRRFRTAEYAASLGLAIDAFD